MLVQQKISQAVKAGRNHLLEQEGYEVFRAYSIPVPDSVLITDVSKAEKLCGDFPFPAVIKIVSPDIIHKSDVGGVMVGIKSASELKTACMQILKNVAERAGSVKIDGILVTRMVDKGIEVVVGGMNNPQFGPVVMFGLGGIYVEVFKDVSFRMAPLSHAEALRQIAQTKAYKLLSGVRGGPPCDLDALAELIIGVGRLLTENPDVKEVDINPVMAFPHGCCAVDARIIL